MLKYFRNLPLMVYAKLIFAILLIAMGIIEKNTYISIMGIVLGLFAFLLKGDCPGNNCTPNYRKKRVRR